jgi:hypothetical protein
MVKITIDKYGKDNNLEYLKKCCSKVSNKALITLILSLSLFIHWI